MLHWLASSVQVTILRCKVSLSHSAWMQWGIAIRPWMSNIDSGLQRLSFWSEASFEQRPCRVVPCLANCADPRYSTMVSHDLVMNEQQNWKGRLLYCEFIWLLSCKAVKLRTVKKECRGIETYLKRISVTACMSGLRTLFPWNPEWFPASKRRSLHQEMQRRLGLMTSSVISTLTEDALKQHDCLLSSDWVQDCACYSWDWLPPSVTSESSFLHHKYFS